MNCTYEYLHVQLSSNKIYCNWMICQIKNRSPHTCDFSICNHDSLRDLTNSNISPLHFLGIIGENSMFTSEHRHGYPYKSDQRDGRTHRQQQTNHLQPHTESPCFTSASTKTASNCNLCISLFPENSVVLQQSHFSTRSRRLSANATNKS